MFKRKIKSIVKKKALVAFCASVFLFGTAFTLTSAIYNSVVEDKVKKAVNEEFENNSKYSCELQMQESELFDKYYKGEISNKQLSNQIEQTRSLENKFLIISKDKENKNSDEINQLYNNYEKSKVTMLAGTGTVVFGAFPYVILSSIDESKKRKSQKKFLKEGGNLDEHEFKVDPNFLTYPMQKCGDYDLMLKEKKPEKTSEQNFVKFK